MLQVQLLGEVTAVRDGEQVLLSRPHRRLLAYLALHPGPHERDALAARFWPDLPDRPGEPAHGGLGAASLARRRRSAGDADDGRAGAGVCDVDELGAALERGERAALDAEPTCVELDDDWADAARAEHRRRCVALLDALADRGGGPGRGGALVGPAVRADPAGRAGAPRPDRTARRGR